MSPLSEPPLANDNGRAALAIAQRVVPSPGGGPGSVLGACDRCVRLDPRAGECSLTPVWDGNHLHLRSIRDSDGERADLAKLRPERNWPNYANRAKRDALWVPARFQIARTRAHFDRFSVISMNPKTEMWSGVDLNPRPLLRLSIAKLPASLAAYSALIKSSRAGEITITTSSPHSLLSTPIA
jgi:hypothetical protein